jgi:hypothetical protein
VATIALMVTVGVIVAGCFPLGARGSIEAPRYVGIPDLGSCSQGFIRPQRQDQICNRQNGNPYN